MNLTAQSQVVTAEVAPSLGVALRFPVGSLVKQDHGSPYIRSREVFGKPGYFFLLHPATNRVCNIVEAWKLLAHYKLVEPGGDL